MDLNLLHFTHPSCLLGLFFIPLVGAWLYYTDQNSTIGKRLEKFIDPHLIPHLLVNSSSTASFPWKKWGLWALATFLFVIALAGPRSNFREVETHTSSQSLVLLLDLSESMNAEDVKPSRLSRAKQKIEDLLHEAPGIKIALIAFAADPHMIAPLTEDSATIRHLLPSLTTDLIYVQGSRLTPALEMAAAMLERENSTHKAILTLSDGGFEDAQAIALAKKLSAKGIYIHAMGIGTKEGAPFKDSKGNIVKKRGVPVIAALDTDRLAAIASAGKGLYLTAEHGKARENALLQALKRAGEETGKQKTTLKIWDEAFYFLAFALLPLLLWWFRKGSFFGSCLLLALIGNSWPLSLSASCWPAFLQNQEEKGKAAFDRGDFEAATATFEDPYRKAVACYRSGRYSEAEELFRSSSREEVAVDAAYNLGNCLAKQQKWQEAMQQYEEVLKANPEHTKALENLELLKKQLQLDQKKESPKESQDSASQETPPQDSSASSQNKEAQSQGNSPKNAEDRSKESGAKKPEETSDETSQDESSEQSQNEKELPQDSRSNAIKENQNEAENKNAPSAEDAPCENRQSENSKPAAALEKKHSRSLSDQEADVWLNRISDDPSSFLKNKFFIESKKNGTQEGVDPW